jgi:hypothetical protein
VLFAMPVMPTVERIEFPSTRHRVTITPRALSSRFILTIMPELDSALR